ncbi:MAG: reverse transcriptase family protein, partial [Planctomycetaceae bacterium]
PNPATPGEYRPLSMLEVLYKIPSRILARRLSLTLPTIIGQHQHGFMAGKGIQEPSLLATHLIQDAQHTNRPLQLISLDIEKAFDRISHAVIIQALRAFGIPELLIQALQQYVLVGYAKVEVNGRKGILITIKTGSGQGDPLSSVLFLIGSEPLNRVISTRFPELMYVTEEGIQIGPILFADDNLSPLKLERVDQINPLIEAYARYTGVSGLNINVRKSTALCINSTPELLADLQQKGFSTPETVRHLGIDLRNTIDETLTTTLQNIDIKAIKRRILATAPPTDTLHRSTLINSALVPLYNHVLMALPATEDALAPLYKEVLSFLWTKTVDGETIPKRRLVAAKRLSASFEKGGLQIQHPKETAEGLRLNLIQKYFRRMVQENSTHFTRIIESILQQEMRPSLEEHVNTLGPAEWNKTGKKIMDKNRMLGLSFQAMSQYLELLEDSQEDWHLAPIRGHTQVNKLFPFYPADLATLAAHGLNTVS